VSSFPSTTNTEESEGFSPFVVVDDSICSREKIPRDLEASTKSSSPLEVMLLRMLSSGCFPGEGRRNFPVRIIPCQCLRDDSDGDDDDDDNSFGVFPTSLLFGCSFITSCLILLLLLPLSVAILVLLLLLSLRAVVVVWMVASKRTS